MLNNTKQQNESFHNQFCVIFDLDGTLSDSETVQVKAHKLLLPQLSLSFQEVMILCRGNSFDRIMEKFENIIGEGLPEDYEKHYRSLIARLFIDELKPIDGVPEMLKDFQYPCCIASNAPAQKINMVLELLKFKSYFGNRIFSAYEVQSWKPSPELLLHAAKKMNFPIENCISIEDSESGVKAALAANMKVFQYIAPESEEKPYPNVEFFQNMRQLPSILDAYCKR